METKEKGRPSPEAAPSEREAKRSTTPIIPISGQTRQVWQLLRDAGPKGQLSIDLQQYGVCHPPRRIADLRELGWNIVTLREGDTRIGRYVMLPDHEVAA